MTISKFLSFAVAASALHVLLLLQQVVPISAYSDGRQAPRTPPSFHERAGTGERSVAPWASNSQQGRLDYNSYRNDKNYYQPEGQGGYGAPMNTVQGNSRRSHRAGGHGNERMQVNLQTEGGRPMDTKVELWDGPGNTSHQMKVWSEDGRARPFSATVLSSSRGGYGGTMDVRNRGPVEFPVNAGVQSHTNQGNGYSTFGGVGGVAMGTKVQGGALKTFRVEPNVASVQVSLQSVGGMPMKAIVELWEGPGQVRQIAEIYNDRGRPTDCVVHTPGYGSTVAIRNKGPMEYPFTANVEPYEYSREGQQYGQYGQYMQQQLY